jgi:murein DD-endopeptidase MepM/ murein hydrolase activator NlpD
MPLDRMRSPTLSFRSASPLALLAALAMGAGCSAPSAPPVSSIGHDIILIPDSTVIRGVVPANATLESMLREQGVAADIMGDVIAAVRTVFDPRRLRSSQPFQIEKTLEGALRQFEYEVDANTFLRVAWDEVEALRAELLPIPKTLEHAVAAGTIDAATPSLYQAMGSTGESPELTIALARVFAGEIDFNTEIQPGATFALAFERFVRDEGPTTYGAITAAEFQNDGRTIRAVRFTPPGGEPAYYDEEGRSLRRFFLRSPLQFEPRITSGYSVRRMHPVLRTPRAHNGVDYGAPTGAPVVAVSSGTVVSATYDNTNGRMVRLRHAGGYESYYLHLSAFGPGVRQGIRVEQGQVIGRVGATGLATGPHLHYGLKKNGAWVDPLREHRNMPPGEPVPADAMDAFLAVRDEALEQLGAAFDEIDTPLLASNER